MIVSRLFLSYVALKKVKEMQYLQDMIFAATTENNVPVALSL